MVAEQQREITTKS